MRVYDFCGFGGKRISVREWAEVTAPKGVVQIVHGMVEHSGRYDSFARYLNSRGYVAFADDHRAHGLTDTDTLGYCDGDIYGDTLKDLEMLAEHYATTLGLPVYLFAHSYGSFLGQRYIQENGKNIAAAVLGGSNYMDTPVIRFGATAASLACSLGGGKKPAKMLNDASFGAYNKRFSEGNFISSIKEECDIQAATEYCSFVCSNAFYKWFFKGVLQAYKKENLNKIPKTLPILLIAGKCDPVGEMGEGVKRLEELYKGYALNVRSVLYDGVRHEFLNDTSRYAAYDEIASFFDDSEK